MRIIKSKSLIFILQVFILILLSNLFKYSFYINFDEGILEERRVIIQFLANLVIFSIRRSNYLIIIFIWIIITLIPVFMFQEYKKAYTMNLLTFFFPNFFFYVFTYRYVPEFFNNFFNELIWQTIILGILLISISISISLLIQRFTKEDLSAQMEGLREIQEKNRARCPHCGTEFESIPEICYNCSKRLIKKKENGENERIDSKE